MNELARDPKRWAGQERSDKSLVETAAVVDGLQIRHGSDLTGTGRAFSAGVDLKALGDRDLTDGSVGDILDVPARRLTDKLANGPLVTIAKVNGFCFTGALELALACRSLRLGRRSGL